MKKTLLLALALAGCGAADNRLSDRQAEPGRNAASTAAADALARTNWTVTAINGRTTPGGAGYFINFADREISAQFGCNRISGQWRLNGDHLSTRDLLQTEMGCPDPAMTFERLGSAVLNSNVRVERISSERMRLVSEAGSIDLKRAI